MSTVFEAVTKNEEALARFLHEKTGGLFLPSCNADYCEKTHNCTAHNPDESEYDLTVKVSGGGTVKISAGSKGTIKVKRTVGFSEQLEANEKL